MTFIWLLTSLEVFFITRENRCFDTLDRFRVKLAKNNFRLIVKISEFWIDDKSIQSSDRKNIIDKLVTLNVRVVRSFAPRLEMMKFKLCLHSILKVLLLDFCCRGKIICLTNWFIHWKLDARVTTVMEKFTSWDRNIVQDNRNMMATTTSPETNLFLPQTFTLGSLLKLNA